MRVSPLEALFRINVAHVLTPYAIIAVEQAFCGDFAFCHDFALPRVRKYLHHPVLSGGPKSQLEAYLQRAAQLDQRVIVPDPNPERGYYYRSDHFSFAKLGVPMLSVGSGLDLIEGGVTAGRAASEVFTANHYHAPSDDINVITRWDGMAADIRLYYRIGRALANDTAWPNWNEGDEFRAARDRSRAGQ